MNKDRVKGTIDDAVGRASARSANGQAIPETQAEGAAQQVKGKVEKASDNVKDADPRREDRCRQGAPEECQAERDPIEHVGSAPAGTHDRR